MSNEEPKKSPEKTEKLSQKEECGAVVEKQQATDPVARSMNVLKIGCPIVFIGLIIVFIKMSDTFGWHSLGLLLVAGGFAFSPFFWDIYMSSQKAQRDLALQSEKKLEQLVAKNSDLEASLADVYANRAKSQSESSWVNKAITILLTKIGKD